MAGSNVKHGFSQDDKASLARFFFRHPHLGKRSPSTYTQFAASHPRHSSESWRGFYTKGIGGEQIDALIRALVRDQKKGKPAPASTDESDHSDESDAPDRPFTPADDEALIAALVKAKINGREPNTVFERLVKLTPKRHSHSAWKARYKADVANLTALVKERYTLHKRKKEEREAAEVTQSSDEDEQAKEVRVAKPKAKGEKLKALDAVEDIVMQERIPTEAGSAKAKPRAIAKPTPAAIALSKEFTEEDDALLITRLAKGKLKSHSLDNVFLFLSQRSQEDNHSVDDWRERYYENRRKFDLRVEATANELRAQGGNAAASTSSAPAKLPVPLLVEPDTEDDMKIDSNPNSHLEPSQLNDSPPTPNPTPPRTNSQDIAAPVLPVPTHFNALRPIAGPSSNAVQQVVAPTESMGIQLELPNASQATSASADSALMDEDDLRIEESLAGPRMEEELTESQKADLLIYGDFDLSHPDLRPRAPPIPRPLPPLAAGVVAEEIEAIQRENVVARAAWTVEEADRVRDIKQELAREAKVAEMEERAKLGLRKQEREKEIAEDKVRRAKEKREKAIAEAETKRERAAAEAKRVEEAKERASAEAAANLRVEIAEQENAKLRALVEGYRRSSSAMEGGRREGTEERTAGENKPRGPKRPRASDLALQRSLTPAPVLEQQPSPHRSPVATTSRVKISPIRTEKKRQREASPPPKIESPSSARRSAPPAKRARIVTPPLVAKALPGKSTDVSLKTRLQRFADIYSIPRKNVASLYFACNADDTSLITDALDYYCERIDEGTTRHALVRGRISREVWSYEEDCVALSAETTSDEMQELRARKGLPVILQRRKFLQSSGRSKVEHLTKGWPWTGWWEDS